MAIFGRRNEFKPDKFGKSLLSRMYIPKRRREKLLRMTLYGMVLVVLSLLQDVVMCRVNILGATTDLVPMGIMLLAMLLGSESCALFSLISSTIFYFSGMAPGPYAIFFLTAIAVALNIFRVSYLRKSTGTTVFLAAAGLLCYELMTFLTGVFLGLTQSARVLVFCVTGILSLPVMPLLMPIYKAIGNIGGDSWID